ncbi:MAG: M28 family peptidase [candidate division NC10 bacterium]|nr:M28 family peptidase [candidate division NC10 bacterium]
MEPAAVRGLLATVEEEALRRWVAAFSGPRHGGQDPARLAAAGERLEGEFRALGLAVRRDAFRYWGRSYFNVVATLPGDSPRRPALLLGAHYDAMAGTPGADDNASGVAVMLAAARALAGLRAAAPIEFVGFSLEEPQIGFDRYRHGSRHFARRAWWGRRRYAGVFVLEMVGYTDRRPGSQAVLPQLRRPVPSTGDFLAAVGTRRARPLLQRLEAARAYVPELSLLTHQVALRGFLLPPSRWSDHAPFWDRGYPAVMLTDTAFLRNPHYHQPTDLPETLDYAFMAAVARLVIGAVAEMGA